MGLTCSAEDSFPLFCSLSQFLYFARDPGYCVVFFPASRNIFASSLKRKENVLLLKMTVLSLQAGHELFMPAAKQSCSASSIQ